ncbi:MAG: dTDP-4-dehydrorhamnose reductase [Actinomycetota bacterium]|nr:dTDP-4-dehydrorhamnose reductase [Actinomycetota bacterium]
MRVLVTGGGGQVGSELAAHLIHHDTVALDRSQLDVCDRHRVEQTLGSVLPDAVVNCAAWTDVDGCESDPERAFRANALAVRHLAVACSRIGAHLVHVSTDYVFPGDKDGPYLEWDRPDPRSVYGHSKLGGELELAAHARSWAIARTSWVFGRRGRNFVDTILARARDGAPLQVVTDQRGCPTYAPDLAGILALLTTGRHQGIFHVTNQGACTWHELARAALELVGLDGTAVGETTSAALDRPAPRPANSVLADTALAASGLPRLRPWREALADKLSAPAEVGA